MIKTAIDFLNNRHKPNYQITSIDGKQYWISRSVAVLAAVVTKVQDDWYVLINKRGEGCPDYAGRWNIPCGYLDWGESCQEACSREIFEECGIEINPDNFKLHSVNSEPDESNQNVTLRHIAIVEPDFLLQELNNSNSEEKEVSDIRWIKFKDANNYEWAFNHAALIQEIYNNLCEI